MKYFNFLQNLDFMLNHKYILSNFYGVLKMNKKYVYPIVNYYNISQNAFVINRYILCKIFLIKNMK
jgi:hypothetical protein